MMSITNISSSPVTIDLNTESRGLRYVRLDCGVSIHVNDNEVTRRTFNLSEAKRTRQPVLRIDSLSDTVHVAPVTVAAQPTTLDVEATLKSWTKSSLAHLANQMNLSDQLPSSNPSKSEYIELLLANSDQVAIAINSLT